MQSKFDKENKSHVKNELNLSKNCKNIVRQEKSQKNEKKKRGNK